MASQAPILADIQLIRSFFVECAVLNNAENPLLVLPEGHQYRLRNVVQPAFDLDAQIVLVELRSHCQVLDKTGQELPVQGHFRLHLTFHVAHLANYFEAPAPDQAPVPGQGLTLTLTSVAYSTARGLIAAKTSETVLQGFVLPLVDVRNLFSPSAEA